MNNLPVNFWKKFRQFLLVGISAMVLLLAGQQGLFTNPRISGFSFAQSDEYTIPNDGDVSRGQEYTPVADDGTSNQQPAPAQTAEYTIPNDGDVSRGAEYNVPAACNVDASWEFVRRDTSCVNGQKCDHYRNTCSGVSDQIGNCSSAECAAPTGGTSGGGQAAPAAPQRTMTSSGGECVNGRMHWVNRFSDGFVDIDPQANEYCSGSGTNAQIVSAPASAKNDACQMNSDGSGTAEECGVPGFGSGHKYCVWSASGNYWSGCRIEACTNNRVAPSCTVDYISGGNSSSQWQCERDIAAGRATCGDNQVFCENDSSGGRRSFMVTKHNGVCNPINGAHDERGCIFLFDIDASTSQDLFCSERGQQPSQPQQLAQPQPQQPQQPQAPVLARTCYVCDNTGFADGQGRWRVDGNGCGANPPFCQVNNSSTFSGCLNAQVGAICETKSNPVCQSNGSCSVGIPQACGQTVVGVDNCGRSCVRSSAACLIPPQGGNITVNPTITNTFNPANTVTNTVTNNVTREVVREVGRVVQQAPTTFGNVGVGNSVVYTERVLQQPIQYTTLPKTGLPQLAWSALAFIPAGLGMRRFARVKKMLENHPSYIFEDRQFKAES